MYNNYIPYIYSVIIYFIKKVYKLTCSYPNLKIK